MEFGNKITVGIWNGTPVGEVYGGTAQNAWAKGDLLYASAVNTLSRLPVSTDGYVLTLASGLPVWAAASGGSSLPSQTGNAGKFLTTDGSTAVWGAVSFSSVNGTASPTQGGTGLTSYAKGDVLVATAANVLGKVSGSATDAYVFTWDAASGLPMWKAASGGGSGSYVRLDGTTPLTGDWDSGDRSITVGNSDANPNSALLLYTKRNVSSSITTVDAPPIKFKAKRYSSGTTIDYTWTIGTNMANGVYPLQVTSRTGLVPLMLYDNGTCQIGSGGLLATSGTPGLFAGSNITLQNNGGQVRIYNGTASTAAGAGLLIYSAGTISGNTADYAHLQINNGWTQTAGAFRGMGIRLVGDVTNSGTATGNYYGIMYETTNSVFGSRHIAFQNNYGDIQLNTLGGSTQIGASTAIAASAILQIVSTTKGFLLPRMTTTQKTAIASPAEGLEVYDTTLHQKSYYNGTTWINL